MDLFSLATKPAHCDTRGTQFRSENEHYNEPTYNYIKAGKKLKDFDSAKSKSVPKDLKNQNQPDQGEKEKQNRVNLSLDSGLKDKSTPSELVSISDKGSKRLFLEEKEGEQLKPNNMMMNNILSSHSRMNRTIFDRKKRIAHCQTLRINKKGSKLEEKRLRVGKEDEFKCNVSMESVVRNEPLSKTKGQKLTLNDLLNAIPDAELEQSGHAEQGRKYNVNDTVSREEVSLSNYKIQQHQLSQILEKSSPAELISKGERVIGRGTFGQVYLLKIPLEGKDQLVVLKVVENSVWKQEEFNNQLACGDIPYVARVYRHIPLQNSHLVLMEYVPYSLVTTVKVESLPRTMAQLIRAVESIHKVGVAHRDLKPRNIGFDMYGNIKILDFGISHRFVGNSSKTKKYAGTVTYMPPELTHPGVTYDVRKFDWWSVGVVMYRLYTGMSVKRNFKTPKGKLVTTYHYNLNLIEDKEAQKVCGNLLQVNPEERIKDLMVVKKLPYFKNIDWNTL